MDVLSFLLRYLLPIVLTAIFTFFLSEPIRLYYAYFIQITRNARCLSDQMKHLEGKMRDLLHGGNSAEVWVNVMNSLKIEVDRFEDDYKKWEHRGFFSRLLFRYGIAMDAGDLLDRAERLAKVDMDARSQPQLPPVQEGMATTVKMGPCGGPGGSPWEVEGISYLTQISIRHGGAIDAISFQYRDSNGFLQQSPRFGGIGGKESLITLVEGEIITSISGYCDTYLRHYVVKSLLITTNYHSYGPFGAQRGMNFSLPMEDCTVIGFHGRCWLFLNAIGVLLNIPVRQGTSGYVTVNASTLTRP